MYSTRSLCDRHLQDLLVGKGARLYKAHLALVQLSLSLLKCSSQQNDATVTHIVPHSYGRDCD